MVIQIPYVIYLLGGVAVRVATNPAGKELAKRLIAQGFKKQAAYKTFKNFTTATKENLVGLITKAKEALSKGKSTSNNKKGDGGSAITTAGGRGQSALGRRIALSKVKNRGKVGPNTQKAPPMKELLKPKPSTVGKKELKAGPPRVKPSGAAAPSVAKRMAQIANIGAGAAIAKVAYDAYKDDKVSETELEVFTRPKSGLSTEAQDVIKKLDVEIKKPKRKAAKESGAQGSAAESTPRQSAKFADTPARKAAIMRALKEAIAFGKNKGK